MTKSAAFLGILLCFFCIFSYLSLGFSIGDGSYFGVFFYQASIIVVVHVIGFLPSMIKQTEHYFDLTGACAGLCSIGFAALSQTSFSIRGVVLSCMVMIWALRLGLFLASRVKKDKVDKRFNVMKTQPVWFFMTWMISCCWVFFTQGPVLIALLNHSAVSFNMLDVLGLCLWSFGFAFEVIADHQKRKFKTLSDQNPPFITTGLWSISRHPNYFGELTLWLGAYIMAFSALNPVQYISFISYPLLALMLIKISGINMLEKKDFERYGKRKDHQAYVKNTACLIPWVW